MKESIKWLGKYLGCVLVFSIVYSITWYLKPDSFIINPQMNIQPFQSIQHFLWEDEPSYSLSSEVDLLQLKKDYDEFYSKIIRSKNKILEADISLKELDLRSDVVSKQRDKDVDNNFSRYDEGQLKEYRLAETKIEKELKAIEAKLPSTVATEADLEIIRAVGNKRIELAKAKTDTATQALKNSEFLLSNITGFFSREVRDEYFEISETRKLLYQERYEHERKIGELRVKAIDSVSKDLAKIRERVKFVDFVFFSIGISTTTTFGDLVANSTATKFIVSLQLLLCIVIVAGFLGSISKQS